jgi:hypothetical protein
MNPTKTLDERIFDQHSNDGAFQDGVSRGKWKINSIEWPIVYIDIRAVQRNNAPESFTFRFECSNYPQSAPTSVPWDVLNKLVLDIIDWPNGTGPVANIFKQGWEPGGGLYLAYDRRGLECHPQWVQTHPRTIWNPSKQIIDYLEVIYELLNSPHYQGTLRSKGNS